MKLWRTKPANVVGYPVRSRRCDGHGTRSAPAFAPRCRLRGTAIVAVDAPRQAVHRDEIVASIEYCDHRLERVGQPQIVAVQERHELGVGVDQVQASISSNRHAAVRRRRHADTRIPVGVRGRHLQRSIRRSVIGHDQFPLGHRLGDHTVEGAPRGTSHGCTRERRSTPWARPRRHHRILAGVRPHEVPPARSLSTFAACIVGRSPRWSWLPPSSRCSGVAVVVAATTISACRHSAPDSRSRTRRRLRSCRRLPSRRPRSTTPARRQTLPSRPCGRRPHRTSKGCRRSAATCRSSHPIRTATC